MKATTAKKQKQQTPATVPLTTEQFRVLQECRELEKAALAEQERAQKAKMIPADVIVNHLDDLDGLNGALNELALLVAADNDLAVPALLNLLRDQYRDLAKNFWQSLRSEGSATGGAA